MKRMFGKATKTEKGSSSSAPSSQSSKPPSTITTTTTNTPPINTTSSATAPPTSTVPPVPPVADDSTVPRSGNATKRMSSKAAMKQQSLEQQLAAAKDQIATEKAGKRKLFHSLVKLANELRRTRSTAGPLMARQAYQERVWYEGGMWRAPTVLPGIYGSMAQQQQQAQQAQGPSTTTTTADPDVVVAGGLSSSMTSARGSMASMASHSSAADAAATSVAAPGIAHRFTRIREAISLSDLFFNLVIVTAFTRVGVTMSQQGGIDWARFFYFAIFWSVWNKEASYSTRFDTTDLSAQMTVLVTCFAVLFACLSTAAPLNSVDANRIMIMAASVAVLYCLLHVRVLWHTSSSHHHHHNSNEHQHHHQHQQSLARHIRHYAVYQIIATSLEAAVWLAGIFLKPVTWKYRWVVFVLALLLGLRIPRAFLANDFHAACSKRGVLFILLLGFLLQSIVVVASEFFEYQTPTLSHYSFLGAACLMLFCIKLLYVDDSDTLAEDHALLVNRWAGFCFNVGQFTLLLSTTVMGSGLNLLTHAFLAATAALPGPEKNLVCGGFSATLLSTFFIKSMHLKRVPTDPRHQALFIAAYVVQTVVLLVVVAITAAMCWSGSTDGFGSGSFFSYLMQTDSQLLYSLSGAALFVVVMSWLDEGVELALYESAEDSRAFRVHPFGFWWCLRPEVSNQAILDHAVAASTADLSSMEGDDSEQKARRSLSVLSPLLGSSVAAGLRDADRAAGSGGGYTALEQQPLAPKRSDSNEV